MDWSGELPHWPKLGFAKGNPDIMYSDVTFAMDGHSSAPHRVGSLLVPQAAQYDIRWVDQDDRSYVTLMVNSDLVDDMIDKVCAMHPSVRCIAVDELSPTAT